MKRLCYFVILSLVGFSCSRSTNQKDELYSKINFQFGHSNSSHGKLSGQSLPTGKKACYAIDVQGLGIPSSQLGTCAPQTGAVAGFVAVGDLLSLTIPKGSERTFEVFMYLADEAETCPALSSDFFNIESNSTKVFSIGKRTGVTLEKDVEDISISTAFPGLSSPVRVTHQGTNCASQTAGLKGALHSSGVVTDSTGVEITNYSNPINDGFYMTPFADNFGIGLITSGGVLNFTSAAYNLQGPYFSVTRKPDTGKVYALLHSGQIVEVTPTSSVSTYTELSASSCPFSVTNCEVPVWIQSISAGYGTKLYGLDHAGQIYEITESGLSLLGQQVPLTVTQVSFY